VGEDLPVLYLARHGETAWTLSRQHTGQVSERAQRVVGRARAVAGNVLAFTSGHFMRVLATRWLGLEPTVNGKLFMLSTASLSALGYEHDVSRPVIRLWSETRHVVA
jgi:broad specificity phosphatase PhoE